MVSPRDWEYLARPGNSKRTAGPAGEQQGQEENSRASRRTAGPVGEQQGQ